MKKVKYSDVTELITLWYTLDGMEFTSTQWNAVSTTDLDVAGIEFTRLEGSLPDGIAAETVFIPMSQYAGRRYLEPVSL